MTRASSIASADLHAFLQTIVTRLIKLPTFRGVLVEDMGQTHLAEPDADRDEARTSAAQSSSWLRICATLPWLSRPASTHTKRPAGAAAMSLSAAARSVRPSCSSTTRRT